MEKTIDLHIHSNLSDGVLSPKEILDVAANNNISTISIADHDTIDAYTKEFYEYAKIKDIQVINAVEISTKNDKTGIHVLGYNFDINNQELQNKLSLLRNARHDYLFNVAAKLNALGYVLNTSELDKIEAVTKAHIALDVINNPVNQTLLLKTFGYIPNKGEFIETVMNEGCPAYVKKESITPSEAAKLIRRAGGKVVLAHPVAYKFEDNLTNEDIQKLVQDINPDGIESYYIYIDRENNKVNEIDKWTSFAKENNLFYTIGSDFHNKDGIHPEIGLINENVKLEKNIIEEMIKNILI